MTREGISKANPSFDKSFNMGRVPAADRDRIIQSFEDGEDFIETARILNVKRATAYTIVRNYNATGRRFALPHAGGRQFKLDDNCVDYLVMMIETNPCITLKRMNMQLRETWPNTPQVSDSTIARVLDGQLISVKKSHDIVATRNEPRIKEQRVLYAEWMYNYGLGGHRIYIDETGFNMYTRRQYGRAPVGQRVNRIVNGQRGRNTTVIVAISDQVGVVYYEIVVGGVTGEIFRNFITSLTAILDNERAFLIMDNAPSHNNIHIDSEYQDLKFLPAYSPFLNPIENCFSVLKSDMKQRLNVVQEEAGNRRAAQEAGMSLVQWRENILKKELTTSMDVITREIFANNYRKANSYLTDCIQSKDIFD